MRGYIHVFIDNDPWRQEIVMVTCTHVAKGQYGLCLVFLTQDKIRKKSLSGNNRVTVSLGW